MKGGLLAGLHALAALHAGRRAPGRHLRRQPGRGDRLPLQRPAHPRLAPEHDAALVLECARANGDIVSARKGIADLEVTFTGRAAHAGVEPEKGRSAILAAARQVVALHALNGRWPGVTLNAGVIEGGTRPERGAGRLPAAARPAGGDRASIRRTPRAEVERLVAASPIEGVTREVRELASHRPMERTPGHRSPGRAGHRHRRRAGLRADATPPPAGPATRTPPPARACRRWTGSARSAATTTRPTNGWTWRASCRARPCWPRSSPGSGRRCRIGPP